MNELDEFLKWWQTLPNPDPRMRYACMEARQDGVQAERARWQAVLDAAGIEATVTDEGVTWTKKEQAQSDPVAWMFKRTVHSSQIDLNGWVDTRFIAAPCDGKLDGVDGTPLYTHPKEPERTRSQKLADAGYSRRPSLWALEARAVLELIATPMRSDGTWNRDRAACRQIAAEALGRHDEEKL